MPATKTTAAPAGSAAFCADCGAAMTEANAFHPYGDCFATRCKGCEAAAWDRIAAKAAAHTAAPGNTTTNVWD